MVKNRLNIPQKILVGFQKRESTYTGQLGFVVYYKNNGTIAKETSWNNWRDNNIEQQEFDNIPTSGFVLNKHVGGCQSGWNFRQSYCRIFDPRGFEFEITIENLLFILEYCSAIKGKGLEGQFVYAWDKKDLVLLPVDSEDYRESSDFGKKVSEGKPTKKSLKIGACYKSYGDDVVYLGELFYRMRDFSVHRIRPFKGTKKLIFCNDKTGEIKPYSLSQVDYLVSENYYAPDIVTDKLEEYSNTFRGYDYKKKIIRLFGKETDETVRTYINKIIANTQEKTIITVRNYTFEESSGKLYETYGVYDIETGELENDTYISSYINVYELDKESNSFICTFELITDKKVLSKYGLSLDEKRVAPYIEFEDGKQIEVDINDLFYN